MVRIKGYALVCSEVGQVWTTLVWFYYKLANFRYARYGLYTDTAVYYIHTYRDVFGDLEYFDISLK
jgi:hypothetical protein